MELLAEFYLLAQLLAICVIQRGVGSSLSRGAGIIGSSFMQIC